MGLVNAAPYIGSAFLCVAISGDLWAGIADSVQQWVLALGPHQLLHWTSWYNFRLGRIRLAYANRRSHLADMATAFYHTSSDGYWNGLERCMCSDLCCRERTRPHSWSSGHELVWTPHWYCLERTGADEDAGKCGQHSGYLWVSARIW